MKIFSFSQLGKYGRLGNQLFQIHGTLGLAEKHGAVATFPAWKYEQYFTPALPHDSPMQTQVFREKYFHYHDWSLSGSFDLLGYMQSEKYFGSTRLKIKDEFIQAQKEKYPELFTRETICIQVRRGDYVGNPNYYQLPHTYYLAALIDHFPNWLDYNILFVSDDIEYCRTNFEGLPNAYFSAGNSDIEDLALGAACDHFIISNSSFGWWIAYLGEKDNSQVIHPGHMFTGDLARNNIKDYRPVRWVEYKRDSYKIPLNDVTFTIPVMFDHMYRKENLDLILFYMQTCFSGCQYIVMEQGGNRFEYTKAWAKYMQMDSKEFHRTKMLNAMADEAQTPIIANWDCDVMIPPAQILHAVEELRAGADMVFPYDGRFCRMKRETWFPLIQKTADLGVIRDTQLHGREIKNSVGGAVLWDRKSFIDAGMENENFISFGPEDVERYNRAKILGLEIRRSRGSLFHMNHFVGPDSSPRNPRFSSNTREEKKVSAMNKKQLQAYIDTWAWRHKYTSQYYHRISEGSIQSARVVMAELEKIGIHPDTVIDIGCGVGEWNNGNPKYWGVDHRVKPADLLIPADHFIDCDLDREFPKLFIPFDLCLCLEVAEHLKPSRAEALIDFLCSTSDLVLFSAAIPNQGGTGHINEQFQSYWARLFFENGFGPMKHQPAIRDCQDVEYWYRQNMILYERGASGRVVDFVLPEYYLQITNGLKGL